MVRFQLRGTFPVKCFLLVLSCMLVLGVADAYAQKKKTRRPVKTRRITPKKQKLPVDSVVIFAYWTEHGVETSGVQLRRKGNDYLLTAILTENIRTSLQQALDYSKRTTQERISNGWLDEEVSFDDSIRISQMPGMEVKVPKTVADKVAEMAAEGYSSPLKKYYTTEEDEYLTGGSWWSMKMQLPGKELVSSGGRNSNGPRWVFDVYDYLYSLKVKNKWKMKRP